MWSDQRIVSTSFSRLSVFSISMSPETLFPIPFCDILRSFLDWCFKGPLPLPKPDRMTLLRTGAFLTPRPAPPRTPRLWKPGSSPSHLISSGEICTWWKDEYPIGIYTELNDYRTVGWFRPQIKVISSATQNDLWIKGRLTCQKLLKQEQMKEWRFLKPTQNSWIETNDDHD